eukprot:COSAG01_NODE_31447_length_597_cov_2.074297_1_plen_59_part_00
MGPVSLVMHEVAQERRLLSWIHNYDELAAFSHTAEELDTLVTQVISLPTAVSLKFWTR